MTGQLRLLQRCLPGMAFTGPTSSGPHEMRSSCGSVPGLVAAATALLVATPAWAEESGDTPPADPHSVRIFVVGAVTPAYVGAADYTFAPLPQIRGTLDGFNFETDATTLEVDLIRDNGKSVDIQFGPAVGVNLDRTGHLHGTRDARVNALGKRDAAVEVGAYAGIAKTGVITSPYDTLSFSVSWQKDVAGAHHSYIITPTIEYGTPLSTRTYVDLSLSADIVGDGYASYYFDVTPAGSAASGLPEYHAKGGLQDVGVTFTVLQSLSGDLRRGWSLIGLVNYTQLLGDTKRAPIVSIVGSSGQWTGAIGLSYVFK